MAFKLTNDQNNTLTKFKNFLKDEAPYLIINGSSGTGKSTLIGYLVEEAQKHYDYWGKEVILTATTNPAVAVLEKLTGIPAQTIYSLLGLTIVPNYRTGEEDLVLSKKAQIAYDKVIIIDESSMIKEELFEFIETRTRDCKIVFIGDWYQLAPVGQLEVTMQSIPGEQALMNKIMRNSGIIAEVGQQFRQTVEDGIFKPIPTGHPEILHVDGVGFQELIDKEFSNPDRDTNGAKILAYTNYTVLEYTKHIRGLLGHSLDLQQGEVALTNKPILNGGMRVSIDSPVVVTGIIEEEYTDKESGIKGRIIELDGMYTSFHPLDTSEGVAYMKLLAKKKDWSGYFGVKNGWLDLRLPYASTVYKAQGSQYNKVFIDLSDIGDCTEASTVARMMYVSITRSRKQVILYDKLPTKYGG